ncbi:MAG TPA: CHAD domain-containing protein [Planctomycetaceae bacterium]|nr:CHAD domain-containing protein [Planctomycetaceae bacterium]
MLTSRDDATEDQDAPWEPPGRWIAGLSGEMPLLDALELIFRQRLEAVLHYLPLAADRAGEDVEYVHKLRVSCRRLAVVLDVVAESLPGAKRKALRALIETIRRRCGKARDLDVRLAFLESLLRRASVENAAAVEFLCETVTRRREKAQTKLRRRLAQLEHELRDAGEALLIALGAFKGDAPEQYSSFGKTGCRILAKELAALWDLAAEDLDSTATLHELRLAGKHLRYAVEVFMPVLPDAFREDFYPQLEEIQSLLGEFHDADEATRSFGRTRKKWKRARRTKAWARRGLTAFRWRELRGGMDGVLLACAQQRDHARTEFLDLWPGFSGQSFRGPVTALLECRET